MEKPEIRFKGYTDEWEQRKLSELSDFITKGATPTTYGYDWQESGIPFFRNDAIKDNQFIYGDFSYISEEANEALQRSEIHGDDILVAITGDIGKAGIVPKSIEKGNINQHTARVRIVKDAIPYFVYQSLITDEQQKKYQLIKTGLSMPQLSLQQIRDTIVLCPSVEEQSMIGECFINLDNLITLHQRKCDEVKTLKKYMLQKMFPQNEQKVPEIRFEGFTEAWEQRKLEDYLEVSSEKNRDELLGKEDVLSVSGEVGIVNQIEFQGRSFAGVSVANYGIVEVGDVVYTKSPLKSNPYGIIKTNKGKTGIVSTLYAVYKPKKNVDSEFVQIYFESDFRMNSYMHPLVNKGAKNDMKVSDANALKGPVFFPKIEEQIVISQYFNSLDHLITLHQQKCEELKKIKKFMLQKMFV
ncbi:MAG: restriction endonuclease subunit S [Blautia sp.]|uniref:restriction endonuclease subunit S n=1 Tax=Blautia sp. TaxID=1955243 RepID=UPI0025C10099|nr:restriction endonuclease subunit S [Blautia sp.]MCI6303929.1 restriction endonuclease subunit S [Blautia sp.]